MPRGRAAAEGSPCLSSRRRAPSGERPGRPALRRPFTDGPREGTAMQVEVHSPWPALLPAPPGGGRAAERGYAGDGRDVLLQGFHWASHAGVGGGAAAGRSWYRVLGENAAAIRAAGFTWVWFPPPSDSLAPQGYIPRRWNVLD